MTIIPKEKYTIIKIQRIHGMVTIVCVYSREEVQQNNLIIMVCKSMNMLQSHRLIDVGTCYNHTG